MGKTCVASFDWRCSGICRSVERIKEVHELCGEGEDALWRLSFWDIASSSSKLRNGILKNADTCISKFVGMENVYVIPEYRTRTREDIGYIIESSIFMRRGNKHLAALQPSILYMAGELYYKFSTITENNNSTSYCKAVYLLLHIIKYILQYISLVWSLVSPTCNIW